MYVSTLKFQTTTRSPAERRVNNSIEQRRGRACLRRRDFICRWTVGDVKRYDINLDDGFTHGQVHTFRLWARQSDNDAEVDTQKDAFSSEGAQNHRNDGRMPAARIWEVPWDKWTTAQMMVQIWALMLPLGFLSVSVARQLSGAPLTPDAKVFVVLAAELLQLLLVVLLIKRFTARYPPLGPSWFCWKEDSTAAAWGVIGGGASLLAVVGLTALSGSQPSQATADVAHILRDGSTWTAVGFLATSAAVAPAVEEYVYRGFLLPSLTRDLPVPAAVCISAALFAASHFSASDGPRLFVLGVVLSSVCVAARGNLAAPTLAHSLYNLAIATSLLLAD